MASKKKMRLNERIHLDNREAFSLPRLSRGLEVMCTDGVIWVTFHSDPRDYVLKKGDRLLMVKGRNALVSAIGESEFVLLPGDGARAMGKSYLPAVERDSTRSLASPGLESPI
jgi:hypothetical protein